MSARPGPRGGYRVSGIPTAIAVALRRCSNLKRRKTKENCRRVCSSKSSGHAHEEVIGSISGRGAPFRAVV